MISRALLTVALLAAAVPAHAAGAQWSSACDNGGRPAARVAVGTAAVAGNLALYAYFKRAWWSGERAPNWFVKNDWDQEFRDQDKLGHVFGGYHLARGGATLLRAACVSRPRAAMWGGLYAAVLQLQIEVWDGYYASYGFSPGDLLANTAGTLLAVAHEGHSRLDVITPTISYAPTEAYRRRREPGHGNAPRATIDYSGQTYWLSVDVDSLLPPRARAYWPGILRVSLGHSITDWLDPVTGQPQRAQRRLLLSLDLDAEKLPGRHPLLRSLKRQLHYYHFPAPAIQLSPGIRGVAWYR